MYNTPKSKKINSNSSPASGFSPVILPQSPAAGSPQKNLTGPPRVARDLVADLYNNIQTWNGGHIKGAQLVKQIAVIKSDDLKTYSMQLEEYTNDLYDVVQNLTNCVRKFELFKTQINALAKLQKSEVLFISHSAASLAKLVENVADAYIAEFKIKEMVLENIAHSKSKDEVMFFAACWTHQTKISRAVNLTLEALLVETGHRGFT